MSSSVIMAEIMLSLYPIVVKSVTLNLYTQVFIRALTFTIISLFFSNMSISTILSSKKYTIISIINLVHIFASYKAFQNLNAGVAVTLFYIYPFFNIIFQSILKKSKIDPKIIKYLMISLLGVAFISLQSMLKDKNKNSFFIGLVSILIAALSESIIYTFYKEESQKNPFDGILTLYFFGTILMFAFAPKFLESKPVNLKKNITTLLVFNVCVGMVGHLFRFYGIPRTTTTIYSVYLFVGVISAYVFGWIFLGEKITIWNIIGTIFILFSAYKVGKNP